MRIAEDHSVTAFTLTELLVVIAIIAILAAIASVGFDTDLSFR